MIFESKLFRLIYATCLSALLINLAYAANPGENCLPFLAGLPNQASMVAPPKYCCHQQQKPIFSPLRLRLHNGGYLIAVMRLS